MKKNEIDLGNNNLTEITEDDLIALCHLNGFKPNELQWLNIYRNNLTNLDFIIQNTSFINLKVLIISSNESIKDISNIKYLTNLQSLYISNLTLNNETETVELLKTMKKLKELVCYGTFRLYTKKELKKELPNIKKILK